MSDIPQAQNVSQLTHDELVALQEQGRIAPDGKILPDPKAVAAAAAPVKIDAPAPSPEVLKRIENGKKLESSFVHETTDGKKAVSQDGGIAAEKSAEKAAAMQASMKPKEPPVEQADKERFLAMLLGASRFEKTYDLFGGAVRVTFRTRTAAEETECALQVNRDEQRDGIEFPRGSEQYQKDRIARFRDYQFMAALVRLGAGTGGVPRVFDGFKHVQANADAKVGAVRLNFEELAKELPHPLLVALREAHWGFENLVARMTLAAEQPDFWKTDAGT